MVEGLDETLYFVLFGCRSTRPKSSNSQMQSSQTDLVRCPPCKVSFSASHNLRFNPPVFDRIDQRTRVALPTFIMSTFDITCSDSAPMEQKVRMNSFHLRNPMSPNESQCSESPLNSGQEMFCVRKF